MKDNIWILAEERPKVNVLKTILEKISLDSKIAVFIDNLRILPILNNSKFTFTYEVIGFHSNKFNRIFIKTVTGKSSFVDYLVFFQEAEPNNADVPAYAIEETKTDYQESRNTGVYQRSSKFVYIDFFYPSIRKIILYNLQIEQKALATDTYTFGTKLLLTLGVEIMGKELDEETFIPFSSIDEIILFKSRMRKAPSGNVPITIHKNKSKITLGARLIKDGRLAHDPNIGAISLISAAIRKLGWSGNIEVSNHGLEQQNIGIRNKFLKIADIYKISIKGIKIPKQDINQVYWEYDLKGEKLGTIFIHIVVESFTNGYSIFENHAGCEKGYFITKNGERIPLAKYSDREKYKSGDKSMIINIPDLILIDFGKNEIINVEGKKYAFKDLGIKELKTFQYIEENYIRKHYSDFKIVRTVVLYGGKENEIIEIEVGFLLNENGDLVLGVKAPNLFKEAIKNLLEFWS